MSLYDLFLNDMSVIKNINYYAKIVFSTQPGVFGEWVFRDNSLI